MQQKGINLKATTDHDVDVPKNGLMAMIAAIDSNSCVMNPAYVHNQVDVGQKAVIRLKFVKMLRIS